jgi:hypothetical protein
MSRATNIKHEIHGLLLLPEGRVQLGEKEFSPVAEVLGALPGDWAVHKPAGIGEAVRCRRGDGTQREFVFISGAWTERTGELVELTPVESGAARDIHAAYWEQFSLDKGECFVARILQEHMGPMKFGLDGSLVLGNRSYSQSEVIDGADFEGYRVYKGNHVWLRNSFVIVEFAHDFRLFLWNHQRRAWYSLTRSKELSSEDFVSAYTGGSPWVLLWYAFWRLFFRFDFRYVVIHDESTPRDGELLRLEHCTGYRDEVPLKYRLQETKGG